MPLPQPQSSQVPFMGTCSFRLISPPMKYCPQPQRSQLSTGEIAPFRLNSAQMKYPPQAVICASSTGGHRRFVPAIGGYCASYSSSSFLQLQQGRKEPFPGRPALLAGLCAKRTAKARQTDREMNTFISRLASWLSFARKLAWRVSSCMRIPFVYFFKLVRRNGSRGPYPAAACGGCRREKVQ